MATKTVQDSSLTSIANAIRTKGGTTAPLEFPTDFVAAIQDIPTGGGGASVPPKEVNFYDYDGTVTNAYTASEFAALSAMPDNPSHDGLTAQGWNWSLADAQAYVAKYGRLNIGQMYVTTSGDTEIDIELHDGRLDPVLGIAPNGTVEIDWGDGSAVDTVTGTSLTSNKDTQHVYASAGNYTITLHVASGSFAITGLEMSSRGSYLLHDVGTTGSEWRTYQNTIQFVRLGHNVNIGGYAFYYCFSLKAITIPDGVTSIGSSALRNCYSLASVTIPSSVTDIGSTAFSYSQALKSVTIPNSVTSIGNSAFRGCQALMSVNIPDNVAILTSYLFQYCASLASVTIPDNVTNIQSSSFNECTCVSNITIPNSVTSIENSALSSCYGIKKVILKPTTPPTLSSAAAFSSMATDRIFIVPNGTLDAYKAAAYWSTYASYMQEEA